MTVTLPRLPRARTRRASLIIAATLVSAVVSLGLLPGSASAHAELLSASPSADSVLDAAPSEIRLTFSEAVDAVPDSIRLVDNAGTEVKLGEIRRDEGGISLAADVPALGKGSYVVAWRAVSADSHPVSGAFTFSVIEQTTTAPGLVEHLLADSQPNGPAERWLALGRGLSYLGITALVGIVMLTIVLAPDVLRLRRRGRIVLLGAAAIGCAGTLLMIAAQSFVAVGDMWAWGEVLDSTAGRWWFVRLGLIGVATVPVLASRRLSTSSWWPTLWMSIGVGLLASVAAGGHGVTGRWVPLGFAATTLHLAAMSTWLGGLALLCFVAPRDQMVGLATRFSRIALVSVIVLAVTGTFNAWRQVGTWGGLTGNNYGTWLIVKLVIVGVVLGIAATSRWLTRADRTGRALSRTLAAEVIGIVFVLAATTGLVNSAPPNVAAQTGVVSTTMIDGDRLAQITLDPAVTGGTTMHVYLSSTRGSLELPADITVTATLKSQNIGPLDIPTDVAGAGHVTTSDANLPLPGTWTFTISARYSEFDQSTFVGDIEVR